MPVSAVGPTFWWGGTVTDANPIALFNQAFLELQFYPDAIVTSCTPDGGYNVVPAKNKFTVCSPVWQVEQEPDGSFNEDAAFNAELFDGHSSKPLVMNAGDTIQVHFFMVSNSLGWFVHVTDLSTHDSGTIVLNSQYGPLQPAFGKQQIGNALGWGSSTTRRTRSCGRSGTPPTSPTRRELLPPRRHQCDSYDAAHWLGFTPLRIKSVTFANGSTRETVGRGQRLRRHRRGKRPLDSTCTSYGGAVLHLPVVRVQRQGRRPHLRRGLSGHAVRLRPGQPVRDHAAVRRPVAGPTPRTATRSSNRSHSVRTSRRNPQRSKPPASTWPGLGRFLAGGSAALRAQQAPVQLTRGCARRDTGWPGTPSARSSRPHRSGARDTSSRLRATAQADVAHLLL